MPGTNSFGSQVEGVAVPDDQAGRPGLSREGPIYGRAIMLAPDGRPGRRVEGPNDLGKDGITMVDGALGPPEEIQLELVSRGGLSRGQFEAQQLDGVA